MRLLALISAFAIISHSVMAAEPPPAQPPRPTIAPAAPQAALSKQQLEHLKSAAEHLAKAGRKEDADKLRHEIAVFESGRAAALLAQKEKELDALRAEVEQLRKLSGRQPQIQLAFQIFEASRDKLNEADIPNLHLLFSKTDGKLRQPRLVEDSAAVRIAVEALRKKDLIRVLAEPTLITVSGREVMFNAGGEFPVVLPQPQGTTSLEYRQFGTRVDALPLFVGDGKVRIEVRAKVSELDPSRRLTINGGAISGLRERSMETAAELRFGETLIMNGVPQQKEETQIDGEGKQHDVTSEVEMLVIVTPTRVDEAKAAANPQPSGSDFYIQVNPVSGTYIPVPTATRAVSPKARN